ncbi:MAG: flagellar basal body P-ring protein FlgI [Thermoguttaceae bacterium]
MRRRHFLLVASSLAMIGFGGCSWLDGTMRSQSPDPIEAAELSSSQAKLVGDLVVPTGLNPTRVDAVGLVTCLHGTGSDPNPSPERAMLLNEMQLRGVKNPDTILRSGNVSLVKIQGYLRAGIQKGDRFDVEVRVPSQSDTTSLRGGYLLETRLTESAILENRVHHGNLLALAQGPIMIDPTADPKKEKIMMCRGRILGGGVSAISRPVGLVLTPGHQDARNSARVANAVNKRFHTLVNGIKTGLAKAKDDKYIELQVHPRYKDCVVRYCEVIRATPLAESASERMQRIAELSEKLMNPETAADAALQLEAIGTEGVDALLKGLKSNNLEVRFYAAESLAYLDRREAAEPLAQIARQEPAFRLHALAALSTMQDFLAFEQLRDMLALPSAETRYGAFRSLWTMNSKDALVRGEVLGDQFHYHVLDLDGPPMVHATRSRLPEIVLFGRDQRLQTPLALNAGNAIMVTSSGGEEVSVAKFSVQDGDQKRVVSTRLDDVIRAIVELGGSYPDVVQALQEAKTGGVLTSRFEIDALPRADREYERVAEDSQSAEPSSEKKADRPKDAATPSRPTPEAFAVQGTAGDSFTPAKTPKADSIDDADAKPAPKKGFFAKIFGQ